MSNTDYRVIGLQAENFKRLKAVSITPDPEENIVKISGRNAQGKTSLLDAIWWALGGSSADRGAGITSPVREGEEKTTVRVDMGDLIVTRSATAKGTKSLTVTNAEGAKYSSPQKMLDELLGALTFDPLAFTRMKPREQVDVLLELVDLDVNLDELDETRKEYFDERRFIGQQKKKLGEAPQIDDTLPTEPESADALLVKLQQAQDLVEDVEATQAEVQRIEDSIAEMEKELAAAKDMLKSAKNRLQDFPSLEDANDAACDAHEALAGVSERNQLIAENNAARERAAEIANLEAEYRRGTQAIADLDERKEKALSAAEFPLDGLSIDDGAVTFNGLPLSQASAAEQLRISTAIAVAANPRVRVARIADGSLLDADSHALLREIAAENDFQVWVELVADGDGVGFVIEDGELV